PGRSLIPHVDTRYDKMSTQGRLRSFVPHARNCVFSLPVRPARRIRTRPRELFAFHCRVCKIASMNPRHAAALALVGWYLILPSPEMATAKKMDSSLSRWSRLGVYASADECHNVFRYWAERFSDEGSEKQW